MNKKSYSVGTMDKSWKGNNVQSITFIVTNDCNLRCKYCYITHKSSNKRMNFSVAKDFIDYLLTSGNKRFSEAVILEFIGGEPFLEVELIDRICDYFKLSAYKLDHPWYWNYRISICTNGVNYSSESVQKFIAKNFNKISVSITLDGTKEKHDLQRVFPDGTGSYDIISKNVDLWLSQFSGSTKVTFASDDLPFLKDSIISLWNRGIKTVNSNVVFENVWKEGDDKVLEDQLVELADYVLDNELYNKDLICSFFDDNIGYPYTEKDFDSTYCGAGKMMALSPDGKIYPCLRYYGYSLNNHEEWPVGNIKEGVDMEKVRPFMLASNRLQSDEECLNCEIATGCAFCQGFDYDVAKTPTNFYRAKYICKMHKARVRANEYYFARLFNRYGIERPERPGYSKKLYFLLSDDYVSYCTYDNKNGFTRRMDKDSVLKGLKFARYNFYKPVFVHSNSKFDFENSKDYEGYDILHIIPARYVGEGKKQGLKRIIPVYNKENLSWDNFGFDNVILNIAETEINSLYDCVKSLLPKVSRINLNITDISKNFDEKMYAAQMKRLKELVMDMVKKQGIFKEISLLTDILFINSHDNCMAGDKTFVLSPEENIYTCCGVYSNESENNIGNIEEGITVDYDFRLYKTKNSNICRLCDAYQCRDCIYVNKLYTKEVNVSPSFQCRKSYIERSVSSALLNDLKDLSVFHNYINGKEIKDLGFLDPIAAFLEINGQGQSYYRYKKA